MQIRRAVLSILMAITVVIGGATEVCAADESRDISAYIDEFRRETRCDTVSVAVIHGNDTELYGDEDGLYQIGSMTKAFTGLAIRKLIHEGTLHETDRISELLPGFTACYHSKPCEITVEQLLTQSSGYTNKEADYPSAAEGMTLAEWAESISGKELNALPGTEYAYSNVNYNLLGAVIERVAGKSYAEYMKTEILMPLGLKNIYVGMPGENAAIVPGSRLGYRQSIRYEQPVIEGRIPAGYFYSDVSDIAAWMRIWTGTADIPEEYKELTEAVKAQLKDSGDYYAGWEMFDGGVIGHSGGTPNYSSRIVFSDTEKIGVCVLTNMNVAASTDGLCKGIYEIVSGGSAGSISVDVWTIFDHVFSLTSLIGILIPVSALYIKKRRILIGTEVILSVLLLSLCIVMPLIFGAGLGEIAFVWAPYSFAGALVIFVIGMLVTGWRLRITRDEN